MGCIISKSPEETPPRRQLKQKDIDKILKGIKYQQEQAAQDGCQDSPAAGVLKTSDSTPVTWLTPIKPRSSHNRSRSMQYMGCRQCHKFSCHCTPATASPLRKTPISTKKIMPENQ